uniref:Pentatricopeptide repeat-containing protein n=1 Tax=Kalanchoe fedtschenkoi TaxID=63787 RepID=A0A7N0TC40_KALFE
MKLFSIPKPCWFFPIRLRLNYLNPLARLIHSDVNNSQLVALVCLSLRQGVSWDILTNKLVGIQMTNSIIEKVLLELNQPADAKTALSFFHWSAQRRNLRHSLQAYCITLHILVRSRMMKDAQALLESVLKSNEGSLAGALLSSYRITSSSHYVFDLLVRTYSRLRMLDRAFEVCCYLEENGITLGVTTFNTLIYVAHRSDRTSLAWSVYEHMFRTRTYPNEVTIRSMVNVLCKEGQMQKSVGILDRVQGKRCSPMVIVNTSLVLSLVEEGRCQEGIMLLKRMLQKNMVPDCIAFSLTVHASVEAGNLDYAWEVFEAMVKRGFQANSFVYTSFIRAYILQQKFDEANRLMREMGEIGLLPYSDTFNNLIEGFAKAGRNEESLNYCDGMVQMRLCPSCRAFNSMVQRLSETVHLNKANELLTRLTDNGFQPDELTYSHLISGFANAGDTAMSLQLYYEMKFRSLLPGESVLTTLIRGLQASGNLAEAEKLSKVRKDCSLTSSS